MQQHYYQGNGNEVALFRRAAEQRVPVMLTGPTGCGKTRFVEHMGEVLGRKVVTISCHDDLTSSDLVGRFMVTGGDVVWTDGPLTRAVISGMEQSTRIRSMGRRLTISAASSALSHLICSFTPKP